jgi:hypothetical protein
MFFTLEISVKLTPQKKDIIYKETMGSYLASDLLKMSSVKLRIPSAIFFITSCRRKGRTHLVKTGLSSATEDIVYKKCPVRKIKAMLSFICTTPILPSGLGTLEVYLQFFSSHT